VDHLKNSRFKNDKNAANRLGRFWKSLDQKQVESGCPSIQAIVLFSALLKTSNEAPNIINDLLIAKQLKVSIRVFTFFKWPLGNIIYIILFSIEFRLS